MTDEIMQELWQTKDAIAKQFNYDFDVLAAELRKRQEESGQEVVDLEEDEAVRNSNP